MKVLSLFDGMSCGQVALKKSSIRVDKYYASEIDKYAISIAQKNFPNTIQLGDVTKIDISKLDCIDLLIGGSPCQSFSNASMTKLNFEDPRGKLFFEFVKLKNELKPKYFLLENVKMKKEWQNIISYHMGVEPIEINSSLVSAQHRKRLYWTNIPNVTVPNDKGIMLKDILEHGFVDRDKSYCIDANYAYAVNPLAYVKKARRQIAVTERGLDFVKKLRESKFSKNGLIQVGIAKDINGHDSLKRVYSQEGKAPTVNAHGGGNTEPKVALTFNPKEYGLERSDWRRLTPLECERLQTLDDNYTEGVSNSQRYKMIGNGWTVDVIKHIFNGIDPIHKQNEFVEKLYNIGVAV